MLNYFSRFARAREATEGVRSLFKPLIKQRLESAKEIINPNYFIIKCFNKEE